MRVLMLVETRIGFFDMHVHISQLSQQARLLLVTQRRDWAPQRVCGLSQQIRTLDKNEPWQGYYFLAP